MAKQSRFHTKEYKSRSKKARKHSPAGYEYLMQQKVLGSRIGRQLKRQQLSEAEILKLEGRKPFGRRYR